MADLGYLEQCIAGGGRGAIFDDDVLIGLDLAEGRTVVGNGFDDVGLDGGVERQRRWQ